jgi:phosphatidylglycerol:prolipoprotein diacylglycerol transferase
LIVHPNFDPVALSIGPVSIHWYGIMYLLGFGTAFALGRYRAGTPGSRWNTEEIIDLVFYMAVGVIAGGRLGYVLFYNPTFYISSPLDIFAIWDGGMSFHGGLLGVVVAIGVYARTTGRSLMNVADFIAPLIAPGLFFGRIGNFINQELWGRVTEMPWGVVFTTAPAQPRHPSQLYEALLEGLVLFIIVWWYSSRPRSPGQVSGLFILGYGVFRILVEFFREPDGHIGMVALNWITMGQVLSMPMVLLGAYLLLRKSQ